MQPSPTMEELDILYPTLRQKIAEGLADLNAGRVTDGEEFFEELAGEEERKPDE